MIEAPPRIYISGGIGNQMFQIAFAHYLNHISRQKYLVVKQKLSSKLPHAQLSFLTKRFNCEHCDYHIDTGVKLVNKMFNPWGVNHLNTKGNNHDSRNSPFISPSELKMQNSCRKFVGYYQNKQFISPIEDIIRQEFMSVLLARSNEFVMGNKFQGVEVVHIRRGDTTTLANKQRVGLLDSSYYRKLLRPVTSWNARVVLTDDLEGAKEILRGIYIDDFYGPNDLDPWSALRVMSLAGRIITANSTFSWWGGFLALENNAEIVIPKPFFASHELKASNALKYRGFLESKASFAE